MTAKDISKIVKYWIEAATHDLEMANSLFRMGKYDYCLFLCHLSMEKLLKSFAKKYLEETKGLWKWLQTSKI